MQITSLLKRMNCSKCINIYPAVEALHLPILYLKILPDLNKADCFMLDTPTKPLLHYYFYELSASSHALHHTEIFSRRLQSTRMTDGKNLRYGCVLRHRRMAVKLTHVRAWANHQVKYKILSLERHAIFYTLVIWNGYCGLSVGPTCQHLWDWEMRKKKGSRGIKRATWSNKPLHHSQWRV